VVVVTVAVVREYLVFRRLLHLSTLSDGGDEVLHK
jgi:hypothetical protein